MKMNRIKRALSILLMACMMLTLIPALPVHAADSYNLTIVNGYVNATLGTEIVIETGKGVNIKADDAPAGKVFDRWKTSDDVGITAPLSALTWVTMGSKNATVTATYKTIPENDAELEMIQVYYNNNKSGWLTNPLIPSYNIGTRNYKLNLDPIYTNGYLFFQKRVVGQSLTATLDGRPQTIKSSGLGFVTGIESFKDGPNVYVVNVVAEDGKIKASYTVTVNRGLSTTYPVIVSNGTTSTPSADAGDKVSITAKSPPSGKMFDKWTSADGVVFANSYSASTSFTMPAKEVTVTASYKDDYGSVTGVDVTPKNASVQKGTTLQFTADVTGTGAYDNSVEWIMTKGVKGTWIDEETGLLTVAADETDKSFMVTAVSLYDTSKGMSVIVKITDAPVAITGVVVTPKTASVQAGKTQTFVAAVTGIGPFDNTVKWSVAGGLPGTIINTAGVLSIAAGETAKSLTVTAAANGDSTKSDSATVTVSPLIVEGMIFTDVDVIISADYLESLLKASVAGLSINVGQSLLTFDNAALAGIKKQSGSKDVIVHIAFADKAKLNDKQKTNVGDNIVYEMSVMSDGKTITDFSGNVTVRLPYTPKAGENLEAIVIYYVDAKGEIQVVKSAAYDARTDTVTFTTSHFSYYMIKNNNIKFNDVLAGFWGKPAIDFAAARGFVAGVGHGKYEPNRAITRAEFVKMIQNVLNLPVAGAGVATYADVDATKWFYATVMSAKSAGILDGLKLADNKFMPNQAITREEMSVLLANTASYKKATASGEKIDLTKFKDYKDFNVDYADKVSTAINFGLLSKEGMGGGNFAPKGSTTRAQAAQVQRNLLKALNFVD